MSGIPDARRQLASLPLAILTLGPGQQIVGANPGAEQFLGQSVRRLTGKRLADIVRFDSARLVERLNDSESPVSAREIEVVIAGIGPRRLDITVAPIVDEPGWQVVTLHDSTPADAMGEDGRGPDDAMLRTPEVLAHEIKNPLAAIRGAAQLLARKVGQAEQPMTRLIADEVDRIAKLIDQMQTLSRRTSAPLEACNLHEAVRRASAVLGAAKARRPRIEEEFDPSLPSVLGNADALVQVLINLIANAHDACRGAGRPRVIVRTRFASGLRLYSSGTASPVRLPIELRVSDNGPGIDPALRDHIFEPFVTSKKTGQGLGLALVRKLVGEMNGRISHERDETGGWTHFRIHLAPAPDERGAAGPEAVAA